MTDTKTEDLNAHPYQKIHDMIDDDLLDAIRKFMVARGKIKTGTVTATFAYLLADSIAQLGRDQKEVCTLAEAFCDYTHQMAHGCFEGNENDTIVLLVGENPKPH